MMSTSSWQKQLKVMPENRLAGIGPAGQARGQLSGWLRNTERAFTFMNRSRAMYLLNTVTL
jgi:hypothetical protein